jgi:hypothetical protein
MSVEVATKLATPATQPTTLPSGKEGPGSGGGPGATGGADFRERMGQNHGGANNVAEANAANQIQANQQLDKTLNTQKVNDAAKIPDNQDFFGRFEKVQRDFDQFIQKSSELDKMVAEGKLKPDDPKVVQQRHAEMRTLLHFQHEMQSTSMQVEIASKVVEHATSGVKTVLSTQA